jgi:undecaprenyl phosphate-alpha-L-ara4FN deformylase
VKHIVLKVDVDTLQGSRVGVPCLQRLLEKEKAQATFLFSLGPDHTGRALRRIFRPGFLRKVVRTSVLTHYSLRTLLYGTFLPGPDIGKKCANEFRAVARAGFECGVHSWNHTAWQDKVRSSDADWTHEHMQLAYRRFGEIFGAAPATHGAAGWQMNSHALKQLDKWKMKYASDGRGQAPYRLSIGQETLTHIQMPTTLPTLDELLGRDQISYDNVVQHLLRHTARFERDEVFTLHAELEGQALSPLFQKLLAGWRTQGYQFTSLGGYYAKLTASKTPAVISLHEPCWGSIPGRSGEVLVQGLKSEQLSGGQYDHA